jgi:hypothetical protein
MMHSSDRESTPPMSYRAAPTSTPSSRSPSPGRETDITDSSPSVHPVPSSVHLDDATSDRKGGRRPEAKKTCVVPGSDRPVAVGFASTPGVPEVAVDRSGTKRGSSTEEPRTALIGPAK